MRHFGGGLRSEALKRAYKLGHRVKATCCVCTEPIYNRMMFKPPNKYAHTRCVKGRTGWDRAW